eukprot:gene8962-biopygen4668
MRTFLRHPAAGARARHGAGCPPPPPLRCARCRTIWTASRGSAPALRHARRPCGMHAGPAACTPALRHARRPCGMHAPVRARGQVPRTVFSAGSGQTVAAAWSREAEARPPLTQRQSSHAVLPTTLGRENNASSSPLIKITPAVRKP